MQMVHIQVFPLSIYLLLMIKDLLIFINRPFIIRSKQIDKEKTWMCTISIWFMVIFVKKVPQTLAGSVKLSITEMFP